MAGETRDGRIARIAEALGEASDGALAWVETGLAALAGPCQRNRLATSWLVSDRLLVDFGDVLRLHHATSAEPFTKDKFEYAMERLGPPAGLTTTRPARNNPGYDLTLGKDRVSLKTQADSSIKPNEIHVSKFMELGKGAWTDVPAQLVGLRAQFFAHLEQYDRIVTLRCLRDVPGSWHYELVEIPQALLARSRTGMLTMAENSKQTPKPGYCRVYDGDTLLFELYFDGGSERKLQIKHIRKDQCEVHAEWIFARSATLA